MHFAPQTTDIESQHFGSLRPTRETRPNARTTQFMERFKGKESES